MSDERNPMMTLSAHWSTWVHVLNHLDKIEDDDPDLGVALMIVRDELRHAERHAFLEVR